MSAAQNPIACNTGQQVPYLHANGMLAQSLPTTGQDLMNLTSVVAFAEALDRDDFDAAIRFVSDDCVYESPSGRIVGAAAIMDSYARNAAWARETFDRLEFKSHVEMRSPTEALIEYTDITEHKGVGHTYKCQQIVEIDGGGMICKITHHEVSGQAEALNAFFEKVGVKRPSKPEQR